MRKITFAIFLTILFAGPASAATVSGDTSVGGKATADVVVYLEGGPTAKPLSKAMVDQRHKTFTPHVSVITTGTTVSFPNDDDVFHNVFAYFQAKRFDLGMYPQGATKKVKFDKPGVVVLLCNIHSSMSAYIMVVNTPYYTVSKDKGHFEIRDVAPGTYTLKGWHESGAEFETTIKVGDSPVTADLSLNQKKVVNISLRAKIILLTTGTVALLAGISLASLGLIAGREIDRAGRNDVLATGEVLNQFLRVESQSMSKQSELLAQQPVLRAVIGTGDRATVTDTADELRRQLGCDGIVITGRTGNILGESGTRAGGQAAPAIAAAIAGTNWSGVISSGGVLSLAVSVPVRNGPDLWGAFLLLRSIDADMAGELKSAVGADVAFVDHNRVIGSSLNLPRRISVSLTSTRIVRSGDVDYISLYGSLPGAPQSQGIGFITMRRYDRVMSTYITCRNALIVITILSLLCAIGAGMILARSLTVPLGGLVAKARELQAGQWPEPFESHRSDEIGLLQNVFDEMTSAMRTSQERLTALIDTDPLTGLDNHRRFQERLHSLVVECRHSSADMSLLLLDLDNFQAINHAQGHAEGDAAIRQLADILRDSCPGVLARYAGDEFAVILPRTDAEAAQAIAERIRRDVERMQSGSANGAQLTVSIGCAAFPTHSQEAEGLLLAAELAVVQAKQLGRNQVCRFDTVAGADSTADPSQLHRFLKDGSLATIQALAAAVDAKDPYTRGHSQSVAQYAVELAKRLDLPRSEIDLIYTTGTLHDVGKIGVPDAILKKPGRLDPDEREIMETHPVLGEVIVRKAPQLAATLPGVRHHHERWDGAGYPDKLTGEDIPFIARLLALADSFDAMTSDRPYRKGMSWEFALAEIERGAGSQFDPELAHVFVKMMRQAHPERLGDQDIRKAA